MIVITIEDIVGAAILVALIVGATGYIITMVVRAKLKQWRGK